MTCIDNCFYGKFHDSIIGTHLNSHWGCGQPNMFNSLRPSCTYMHHQPRPSLVQIMACCLIAWSVNQCCIIVNWPLRNKIQLNCIQNKNILIQENALKMLSGKCRPFCLDLNVLTHWCLNQMTAFSQTTVSDVFSWMKIFICWFQFD